MTQELINKSYIERFLNGLSDNLKDSLNLLVIPNILEDSLAKAILTKAGKNEHESTQIIEKLKCYPIWHDRTIYTWAFDEDIRQYVIEKMHNSTVHRKMVLSTMKEHLGKINDSYLYGDYYIQIARLSLSIDENMKEGICVLRKIFDAGVSLGQFSLESVSEAERVVDLYLSEQFSGNENYDENLPEEILNVCFMRGFYAYKTKRYLDAMHFLSPVWKQENSENTMDASIAAHLVGIILSKNKSRWEESKNALCESIQLSKKAKNKKGEAQVYISLGNLLRKNEELWEEAEKAYKQSIQISKEQNDLPILAMGYIYYASLLGKGQSKCKEAERFFEESIEVAVKSNDLLTMFRAYYNYANHLSKEESRWSEAKKLYEKSMEIGQRLNSIPYLSMAYNSYRKHMRKK